ncbi:MAG TPA: FHA domain-containing protein [Jiangellaceae bacterium]|nr:FHA domain-containing protein [Jiangellaceae bacterium]
MRTDILGTAPLLSIREAARGGRTLPMPFCTQCGHENPADAKFCSQCGSRLVTAPAAEPAAEVTSTMALQREDVERDEVGDLGPADQAAVDALPAGSALLAVLRGPNAGSRFLLDTDVVKAGRHPDSDIFLDDVTVSRRHAEFRRTPEGFVVTDVGSLNGTYVNRDRIDEVLLKGGDEVQVGKYRLVYYASQHGFGGGVR